MQHQKKMYFILSQSGGGKDTQCGKLLGWFQSHEVDYLHVNIGSAIRLTVGELGKESLFAKNLDRISSQGMLQPAVLPTFFFLSSFIDKYTGSEIIIVNGSPRSVLETELWSTLITSGYLPPAVIVHLDVPDDECRRRLIARGDRADTMDETARERKLAWYAPIREMLRAKLPAGFELVTIDGMQSPGQIHAELRELFVSEGVIKT